MIKRFHLETLSRSGCSRSSFRSHSKLSSKTHQQMMGYISQLLEGSRVALGRVTSRVTPILTLFGVLLTLPIATQQP